MKITKRLAADAALTVDQVVEISRRERHEVVRAIENRSLPAQREQGDVVVLAADMRRWLART